MEFDRSDAGSTEAWALTRDLPLSPEAKLVWLLAAAEATLDVDLLSRWSGLDVALVTDVMADTWRAIPWLVPVPPPPVIDPRRLASKAQRILVFTRDGAACVLCGATSDLHIDHIFPHSKGGRTEVDNLQTLCRRCNLQKGDR